MLGGLIAVLGRHLIEVIKLKAYAVALYAAAAVSLLFAFVFALVSLRHWIVMTFNASYPDLVDRRGLHRHHGNFRWRGGLHAKARAADPTGGGSRLPGRTASGEVCYAPAQPAHRRGRCRPARRPVPWPAYDASLDVNQRLLPVCGEESSQPPRACRFASVRSLSAFSLMKPPASL